MIIIFIIQMILHYSINAIKKCTKHTTISIFTILHLSMISDAAIRLSIFANISAICLLIMIFRSLLLTVGQTYHYSLRFSILSMISNDPICNMLANHRFLMPSSKESLTFFDSAINFELCFLSRLQFHLQFSS